MATTLNSFSGIQKAIIKDGIFISTKGTTPGQDHTDSETPQNAEEEQNNDKDDKDGKDDKVEDTDDLFVLEHAALSHVSNYVNHVCDYQIALYREHHRVIFSPPPEA